MNREYRSIDLSPPTEMPPPVVSVEQATDTAEQWAARVRNIYVMVARSYKGDMTYGSGPMPQWDGGQDRWGRRRRSVWPALAQHILSLDADPLAYIQAQFANLRRGRPPQPNQMMDEIAVENYRRYQNADPAELQRRFDNQLLTVGMEVDSLVTACGWEYEKALRSTLMNVAWITVSPLFRYCLAYLEDVPAVLDRFHDNALFEYAFQQRAYDDAWGDRIPAQLRQEGTELKERLLSY